MIASTQILDAALACEAGAAGDATAAVAEWLRGACGDVVASCALARALGGRTLGELSLAADDLAGKVEAGKREAVGPLLDIHGIVLAEEAGSSLRLAA